MARGSQPPQVVAYKKLQILARADRTGVNRHTLPDRIIQDADGTVLTIDTTGPLRLPRSSCCGLCPEETSRKRAE